MNKNIEKIKKGARSNWGNRAKGAWGKKIMGQKGCRDKEGYTREEERQ